MNNPLDLTLATAKSKFRHRPIWALTYSQKRFRQKPDNLADVFLKRQGLPGKYWRAEREFVVDNRGQNAIIERLVDGGGKVQRLAILRVYDDQSYCYRYEERFSRIGFMASDLMMIPGDLDLPHLFTSDQPMSHNLIDTSLSLGVNFS